MIERLEQILSRYNDIREKLSTTEVIQDIKETMELSKELRSLENTVETYKEYKIVLDGIKEAKEMLNDKELGDFAKEELSNLEPKKQELEEKLEILLIPKDPNDDNNVICEIRGGAGGEEAALFAGVLFRMYSMYAEKKHFQIQVINENETGLGGYKEKRILCFKD